LASTASEKAGEKVTCVIETSSRTRLNRDARRSRLSRTSLETISRCVTNWLQGARKYQPGLLGQGEAGVLACLALNWATTDLSTSLTIEGSTRSS